MMNPVATWAAEHQRFSRLLTYLDQQLAALHEEQEPDYALMRDVVYYLHRVTGECHHPREDVAFERLACRDPALALPVNRLRQEHRVLEAAGEELLALVEDVSEDAVIERGKLEAAMATYVVYYHHHLACEEAEILPRAAELLTPDDWASVETAVSAAPGDPLLGASAGGTYRDLQQRIGEAGSRL